MQTVIVESAPWPYRGMPLYQSKGPSLRGTSTLPKMRVKVEANKKLMEEMLRSRPHTAHELMSATGLSQSTVHYRMTIWLEAGLIEHFELPGRVSKKSVKTAFRWIAK